MAEYLVLDGERTERYNYVLNNGAREGASMGKQSTNAKVSNFTKINPMHGEVNGEPVRCIAYGDVEGNSPSYLTIDSHGTSSWQSLSDVNITDTNFLPVASASSSSRNSNLTGSHPR